MCFSNGIKTTAKTVKDTLEQLNQAKELQQKIIQKKELERKQSNLHDYAPTIEKKRNFFLLQSKSNKYIHIGKIIKLQKRLL